MWTRGKKGSKMEIIRRWLESVKKVGVDPEVLHLDKDFAEVSAARLVFPSTSISLCYWHVKDAWDCRLSQPPSESPKYYSGDAALLIGPGFNHDFGPARNSAKSQYRSGLSFDGRIALATTTPETIPPFPESDIPPPSTSHSLQTHSAPLPCTQPSNRVAFATNLIRQLGLGHEVADEACDGDENPAPTFSKKRPRGGKKAKGATKNLAVRSF
jgi:hypothetical protein